MSRFGGGLAALVAAACSIASPRMAGAVEREHHLGVDVGPSVLVVSGHGSKLGPDLAVHWAYGLNDMFNLVAEGGWSFAAIGARPSGIADAGVGVTYVLDVLQWVPYFGLIAGAYELVGPAIAGPKLLPGLAIAAGLDYRIDRSVAVGLAVREHMLVTEASSYPSFVQVLGRVEWTWGW